MLVKINAIKLKQLREQRCWSQQQLADFASLSLRTVQRIEARAVASQESLKCIAAVFEIPVDTLMDNTPPPSDTNEQKPVDQSNVAPPWQVESDEQKKQRNSAFKTLYISFAVVFISHMFGFLGIFSAFDEGKISFEMFQLLKGALSLVLIISAGILWLKDRRLRKKYRVGSLI